MNWHLDDVIVALGSATGPAPRGIIRASGPQVATFLDGRFVADDSTDWQAARLPQRHAGRLTIANVSTSIPLAVHYWPTRRSYTGQPLIELHMVSSPPLLDAVLTEWCRHGARLARPGEFTLRAFLAGKLDLLQAEAVLGVIDADDGDTLRRALEQLAGGVSHRLATMRHDLLNLLADVEAGLDFVEEHLEFVSRGQMLERIADARLFVEQLSQQATARMHHAERPRVVLAGLPNAGKSTLFNALVGKDAALVSNVAGTTRDFLEARLDCQGIVFDLIDTAGWESADQGIDGQAQQHRADQFTRADIIVWCTPIDTAADAEALDVPTESKMIRVMTKADRGDESTDIPAGTLSVSSHTGAGLEKLRQALADEWRIKSASSWLWLGTTAARCEESLQATLASLQRAEAAAADPIIGDELIAIELRDALDHLGRIVGAVYTDDLLDRIFSRFCIGK
jgi:tRNA modification GTPase